MRKIILALLLVFTTVVVAKESHAEIQWAKDFQSGISQATMAKKPVLFVFSRHTCKYCVVLEKTTFADKRVIKALNRDFISIISYSDENDYTPRELWRPGTPTLWFLLPSGKPMFQPLMGAVGEEGFLEALATVKKDFDKRMAEKNGAKK